MMVNDGKAKKGIDAGQTCTQSCRELTNFLNYQKASSEND